MTEKCAVVGCCNPVLSREWCRSHYRRWQKHGDPLGGRIPQGEARRFFQETVLQYSEDNCLFWPYGRDSSGYGRIWNGEKAENVCRLICEDKSGPAPLGNYAAHSCGNGHNGCVNPQHLRWATPLENAADREFHKAVGLGRFAAA